ncbi:uncharacterized protein with HEPN domain [Natronocella acetinitrilica]|uniref:Uncharacterized protein with HEPN domain n=1 Tax=Natronocella acetinitrilica TaxID=414046 RepID=A0AAE3G1Z0_9GAMM|nr:DUF86 domain-containing protein [Natronocella acetinitrilica]MCP1674335.1 uncharacterized protein with HEPN domain [Natronocella acetinitrilica]
MTRDGQRLADYLAHILEAIDRIDRYTDDMDEEAFLDSQLVQDAVIRNIEIIGEASNNIQKRYPQFAARHPRLPLSSAYQMRNIVAHGYFKVDFAIVWRTIQHELPDLYRQIQDLPGQVPGGDHDAEHKP